jgi:hypothetical protein
MTYFDVRTRDLMYATDSTGTWEYYRADSVGYTGKNTSIAFDTEGAMHLSYYDVDLDVLRYATDRQGTVSMHTLGVSVSGTGRGSVNSAPSGISCGDDCRHAFSDNTTITLSASPYPFSEFTGWFGDACSGTDLCRVTLNESTYVKAVFDHRCPAIELLQGRPRGLSLLRGYRDSVLVETPQGKLLTQLYYAHASELVRIFSGNASLRIEAAGFLADLIPYVEARLNGERTPLPEMLQERAALLCDRLYPEAGPELQQTIDRVKTMMEDGWLAAF